MLRLSQPTTNVVSLKELMKEFGVYVLVIRLETLDTCCKQLQEMDAAHADPSVINDGFIDLMVQVFGGLKEASQNLFADSTLISQIEALEKGFIDRTVDRRPAVLHSQMKSVLDGVLHNLGKRKFMILSEEEAGFYASFNTFGESFKDKYPMRAFVDTVHAGNAYAAGLYTACVFHCMRVAEYGLRKLAANRSLRVKLHKKESLALSNTPHGKTL